MNEKEKIKAEIGNHYRMIVQKEKEFEKAKAKRTIITILAFAVLYFALLMISGSNTGILGIIGTMLASIFLAGIHFVINATVFGQLSEVGKRETAALEHIRNRIRELENKLERLED